MRGTVMQGLGMRGFRVHWLVGVVALGVLGVLPAAWAPAAQAGDCGCGSYGGYRTGRSSSSCGNGSRSYRNPCHPSTRILAPRSGRYGCGGRSNWFALRRGLRSDRRLGTSTIWVRQYFMRRYPFAQVEGDELLHMEELLALGTEMDPDGAGHVPNTATRLERGMARFFVGDYDDARSDFEAVLAEQPKEHRARFGVLFCAVCRSDWRSASKTLGVLAKAGELKADDQLVAEGTFLNPKAFDGVVKGAESFAQHQVTDGNAYLVTAWALASTGDKSLAKRYLRLAKRWKPGNAAIGALEANLSVSQAKPKVQPKAQPKAEPKPAKSKSAESTPVRAPAVELHRQIAQKTKSS
jgi:hypothetical protein